MKKLYMTSLLSLALGMLMINTTNAQNANKNAEIAPNIVVNSVPSSSSVTAIFDLQWSFFPDSIVPTVGCVGTLNTGTEIWISRWSGAAIFRFDYTGAFIDSFIVSGVTGTRSMTTDGTYAYFAINGTSIKKINMTTHALVSSINVPPLTGSANTTTRWATYDPTLNGGAGGFWIGNYDTDILSIDMTGAQLLTVISASSHGLTAMYGAAIDNLSPGGPFLWANCQTDPATGTTTGAYMTQIDVTNQIQTGLFHDMEPDFGTLGGIAGGISITTLPGFSQPCLFANDQGVQTAAYELVPTGLKKIDLHGAFSLSPNPVQKNGYLKINYQPLTKENFTVTVTDLNGKVVYTKDFTNCTGINSSIPVNNAIGVYTVSILNENGQISTKKITVQ